MTGPQGVPILTQQEMSRLEADLIRQRGDQGEALMRQAGLEAAHVLLDEFGPAATEDAPLHIGIICGWGNNGGDGLVLARSLSEQARFRVTVLEVNPQRRSSSLAQKMRRELPPAIQVRALESARDLIDGFDTLDVLVDALFGVGLNRQIERFESELIDRINGLGLNHIPVVSLDVPSGLNATTGATWGNVVTADMTVTFGAMKSGLWIGEGLQARGTLKLLSAGFPVEMVQSASRSFLGFGLEDVSRMVPRRESQSHKYTNGKVLIVGGSTGMWGAAVLAATGALRTGAGHVTIASFDSPSDLLSVLPEVLLIDLRRQEVDWSAYDAILIGPGLSESAELIRVQEELLARKISQVIVDAGALSALGTLLSRKSQIPGLSGWSLTPHEGEARRLVQKLVPSPEASAGDPPSGRWTLYEHLSKQFPGTVVLKGPKTWVFRSDLKPVAMVMTGCDSLAKAGSGDVLAGVMLALLAQSGDPMASAIMACVIHGAAGDLWAARHGRRSLLVSELPGLVGEILFALERK